MPAHKTIRNRPVYEQVRFREITGFPVAIAARLHRKVGGLSRYSFHVKVGITNDPYRRWQQAYRHHGWRKMHVLYRSSSHKQVCTLEARLIERANGGLVSSPGWYWNCTGGGGGRKPSCGPYYLYVVVAPKYARLS